MSTTEQLYSVLMAAYRELLQGLQEVKAAGDPAECLQDLEMECWGFAQAIAIMSMDYHSAADICWPDIQMEALGLERRERGV